MADDPLLVTKVIRVLAQELKTTAIQFHVCGDCALKRADEAREAETWHAKGGYYVLDPDQERYGRFADTGGGATTVARRTSKSATVTEEAPEVTQATETAWDEAATSEPTAEEAAAAEDAKTPAPTAQESRTAKLREQFPAETKVKLNASEYKNSYGTVLGIEERRGVGYPQVRIDTYANGRRREGDKVKTILTRAESLDVVDAYPEVEPAPATTETAAQEPTE